MIEKYKVDGVIEIILQACHTFNVESVSMRRTVEDAGIPYMKIKTDYSLTDSGQLATRIEAFIRLKEQTISTEAAMTIGCITGSESLIQYAEKSGEEEENMKMCKALEKLVEEGKLEGESRSFILIQKLFSENKIEEVKKVSEDKAYREEMYEKYGL